MAVNGARYRCSNLHNAGASHGRERDWAKHGGKARWYTFCSIAALLSRLQGQRIGRQRFEPLSVLAFMAQEMQFVVLFNLATQWITHVPESDLHGTIPYHEHTLVK